MMSSARRLTRLGATLRAPSLAATRTCESEIRGPPTNAQCAGRHDPKDESHSGSTEHPGPHTRIRRRRVRRRVHRGLRRRRRWPSRSRSQHGDRWVVHGSSAAVVVFKDGPVTSRDEQVALARPEPTVNAREHVGAAHRRALDFDDLR
jgi:hypothetical protein